MTTGSPGEVVRLDLSKDEALVLFDWLAEFNAADADDAVRRVLSDLEATLEKLLVEPFDPAYRKLLDDAKARLLERG